MSPAEEATLLDISREELERALDEAAQKYLGMSGSQFVELVDRGGPLPEHPMVAHLLLMMGARPSSE